MALRVTYNGLRLEPDASGNFVTYNGVYVADIATGGTTIQADAVAFTLAAGNANVNAAKNISAGSTGLTLTPNNATIRYDVNVSAGSTALTLSALSANVNAATKISAAAAGLTLTTYNAAVQYGDNVTVQAGSVGLTLSPLAASVNAKKNISAGSVGLTLTPQNATVNYGVTIQAGSVAFTITPQNATVTAPAGTTVQAGSIALTLSPLNATVTATALEVASAAAVWTEIDKRLFVWFETNAQSSLDSWLANAGDWLLCGKPIITARRSNVINFLNQVGSSYSVYSGFKTSDFFTDFNYESSSNWSDVAALARDVADLTDGPVVLENEGALNAYVNDGNTSVSVTNMVAAISAQTWPDEIWWWSAPANNTEPKKTLTRDIADAVMQGIPNCRLIEASSAGYTTVNSDNLNRTIALDPTPLSILYFEDNHSTQWDFDDALTSIDRAFGSDLIIYPGIADVGRGEEMYEIIKSAAVVSQPGKSVWSEID